MSRLLRNQLTKHMNATHICDGCLQHFTTHKILEGHKKECGGVVTILPEKDNSTLKFKNFHKKERVPFVVYADAESILEDVSWGTINGKKTVTVKKHIPCAFSYSIHCSLDNNLNKFKSFSGPNAANDFLENLIKDSKYIYNNYLTKTRPMNRLTPLELEDFDSSRLCHICEKELGNDRVKDHCHLTGKYRGAAHNSCNLEYRVARFVPILFHNFSSYDCHLFIKELVRFGGDISVIPLNKEKYVSMSYFVKTKEFASTLDDNSIHSEKREKNAPNLELRFLDSFRFMSASLDSLAKNLPPSEFKAVRTQFPNDADFNLMTRKGVFPYEYISSFNKLLENQLPSREEFHNKLTDSECSLEDYEHALRVWNHFNCQTLKDYLELYLKTDVLLLADIFENFRDLCIRVHKLDPCQYITAPSLSWDAMLLCTGVELELFTDINMYNFCKNGIRGGLTQCSTRHSVANNPSMSNYDQSKPDVNIYYLDVNNLYGMAMTQYLPIKDFKWVEEEELEKFNDINKILSIPDDSPTGFIFDVEIEYPANLHDIHNDLPFCPENKCIGGSKTKKLIADFSDKKSYTIHYRVLKQCLKHNLILKKVNRCLSFTQSNWLEKYIMKNNNLRAKATNAFEKDLYKLFNNSVYGKTMENVDKRKIVQIRTHWESHGKRLGARDFISKPNFHSLSQFSEDMVAIEMNKVKVKYDKPIYLGFCVLEISKWVMYDFLYDFLKVKFGNDFILNYMDTDSFILTFFGRDLYRELTLDDIKARFDTSDFSPSNVYKLPLLNKKVIGMMKDENAGKTMTEFVGLRPKMYAIKVSDSEEVKKSKGVKKCVLKKYTIDTYRDCLYNKQNYFNSMYTFRSRKHDVYTDRITKVCLSFQDDKRFIREDGIHTYAWGHYRINEDFTDLSNLHSTIPMDVDLDLNELQNSNLGTIDEVLDFASNNGNTSPMNVENILPNFGALNSLDLAHIPLLDLNLNINDIHNIELPSPIEEQSIFNMLN
ncbi:uncharacterized protein LOC131800720 [Musca domestica]|uniref:DNA-directed DNA polymerase n=1 Tax=Musca domestica TaxID=7370 RepID=A0ABM3ULH4_MUSDO|nr:uncharacterized protein LOC131800720 [Musca domestica]